MRIKMLKNTKTADDATFVRGVSYTVDEARARDFISGGLANPDDAEARGIADAALTERKETTAHIADRERQRQELDRMTSRPVEALRPGHVSEHANPAPLNPADRVITDTGGTPKAPQAAVPSGPEDANTAQKTERAAATLAGPPAGPIVATNPGTHGPETQAPQSPRPRTTPRTSGT